MSLIATTLAPWAKGASFTLSGGNLTATLASGTASVLASRSVLGDMYCEIATSNVANNASYVGLASNNWITGGHTLTAQLGTDNQSLGYLNTTGVVSYNAGTITTLATWATGAVICVAISVGQRKIWFRVNNGNWNNDVIGNQNPDGYVGGIDLATSAANVAEGAAIAYSTTTNGAATAQFTSASWTYSAPTGYGALSANAGTGATASRTQSRTSTPAGPTTQRITVPGVKMFTAGTPHTPLSASVTIAGNIKEGGTDVAGRVVRVYDNLTGELLETVTSDGSGNYSALCHARDQVFAVAFDPTSYQAQVYDRITPG